MEAGDKGRWLNVSAAPTIDIVLLCVSVVAVEALAVVFVRYFSLPLLRLDQRSEGLQFFRGPEILQLAVGLGLVWSRI